LSIKGSVMTSYCWSWLNISEKGVGSSSQAGGKALFGRSSILPSRCSPRRNNKHCHHLKQWEEETLNSNQTRSMTTMVHQTLKFQVPLIKLAAVCNQSHCFSLFHPFIAFPTFLSTETLQGFEFESKWCSKNIFNTCSISNNEVVKAD